MKYTINIIKYNYPAYFVGIIIALISWGLNYCYSFKNEYVHFLINFMLFTPLVLIVLSVIGSYLAYDLFSPFDIKKLNLNPVVDTFLLITAGLDDYSVNLNNRLKINRFHLHDFYDETKHTEKSIQRARSYNKSELHFNKNIIIKEISEKYDVIFAPFCLHEIRDKNERLRFLIHLKNHLNEGGKIIVIEHSRNLFNYLAFNFGVFHFYGRNSWMKWFNQTGISKIQRFNLNYFIDIYYLN